MQATYALEIYFFFQSAPKINRRFITSKNLLGLPTLNPDFPTSCLVPSEEEQTKIGAILTTNPGGHLLHSTLFTFLSEPPTITGHWLPEFHRFFLWLLEIFREQMKQLASLRSPKDTNEPPPLRLPEPLIDLAFNNLGGLHFFAWDSPFFRDYIRLLAPPPLPPKTSVPTEGASTELATQTVEPNAPIDVPQTSSEAVDVLSDDDEESEVEGQELGLDISTEFETAEEPASATAPAPLLDPCIQELRLISSNLEHLNRVQLRAPKSRFRFQIIQYAPSGQALKPWPELIHELFPKQARAEQVIARLLTEPGRKFLALRKPTLVFPGQAHCEAVLACLYTLSKRDEDISWVPSPFASFSQRLANSEDRHPYLCARHYPQLL